MPIKTLIFTVISLIVFGCKSRSDSDLRVVGSSALTAAEMKIPVQLISTKGCVDSFMGISICSGVRIANGLVATAAHCVANKENVYILSGVEEMIALKTLGKSEFEYEFKSKIRCDDFEKERLKFADQEKLVKIDRSNILYNKKIDVIAAAITEKKAIDFAIIKSDSAVLKRYNIVELDTATKLGRNINIAIYGNGLTNCYAFVDGKLAKISSKQMIPRMRTAGIGRVDGQLLTGVDRSQWMNSTYSYLEGKRDFEVFQEGVLVIKQQRDNFTCGGDSGAPIINTDNGKLIGIHSTPKYEAGQIADVFSLGSWINSQWSCELLKGAGVTHELCR